MAKIEYEDKVALIVNPDIPDINKVTNNDMNEIKQVVNENDDKFLTNGLNISNEVDEDYRVNVLYSRNNMIGFINGTYTQGNITAVVNNGTITLSGTSSGTTFVAIPLSINFDLNNASYYTISINNNNTGDVKFRIENSGSYDVACSQQNAKLTIQYSNSKPLLKTIIYIRVADGVNTNGFILKPMINKGTTALDYEPYITPSIIVDNEEIYSKWKYLGQTTGTTKLQLPNNWKELYIMAKEGSGATYETAIIMNIGLSAYTQYCIGGRFTSGTNGSGIMASIDADNKIGLNYVYVNSSDVVSNSSMLVYWK